MKKVSLGLTLALAAGFATSASFAATTAAAPAVATTPAADNTSAAKSTGILSRFAADLYTGYSGPSLGSPGKLRPDEDTGKMGDDAKSQSLENWLGAYYRLNPDLKVGVLTQFAIQPWDAKTAFEMRDPALRLKHSNLWSKAGFQLKSDLRLYVPATSSSQAKGMIAGLRTSPALNYDIPGTRISLGLDTMLRLNAFNSTGTGRASALQARVSAYANYNFRDNLSAGIWSDLTQPEISARDGSASNGSLANLQPNLNWDISPAISLNPYLNFFPGNLSADSTYVGMNVALTFL